MGWEEEIAAMLQEVVSETVRFDIEQPLTEVEKSRARNNIGIVTTATNISGDDYRIEIGW